MIVMLLSHFRRGLAGEVGNSHHPQAQWPCSCSTHARPQPWYAQTRRTLRPDHKVEALVQAAIQGFDVVLLIVLCGARPRLPASASRGVSAFALVVLCPELRQGPVMPSLDLLLPLIMCKLPGWRKGQYDLASMSVSSLRHLHCHKQLAASEQQPHRDAFQHQCHVQLILPSNLSRPQSLSMSPAACRCQLPCLCCNFGTIVQLPRTVYATYGSMKLAAGHRTSPGLVALSLAPCTRLGARLRHIY